MENGSAIAVTPKGELRRARKLARAEGQPLTGPLAIHERDRSPVEFTETVRGYWARERWARAYDERNGAPEGDWDR